ncbi:MAG: carboxypeptidase-like regulatory domain-containing protein, partial [Bacteroidota bacterium]
ERKFPTDATVTNAKPANSYLLFGPSFRFGRRVQFGAEVNGGMFYNNAGGVTIAQQGAQRSLFRFDNGSKNIFPGFSGSVNIGYPINNSTQFFVNTDYLQTQSSIRLFDPQRGIDIATEQNRNVKLFTVGIGITKSFNTKKAAAAKNEMAYEEGRESSSQRYAPRDVATGQSSGRRVLPTVNKRGVAIDEVGVQLYETNAPRDVATGQSSGRIANENCGPVTIKQTLSDGSAIEKTFACTNDALAYERQTQGATFGEKVNQGLHAAGSAQGQRNTFGEKVNQGLHAAGSALSQGASRNFLVGKISWTSNANNIVTNKTKLAGGAGGGAAAASYAATGMVINNGNAPTGLTANIYARDAASGLASGKRAKDAGSGIASGRRQYEHIYFEEGGETLGKVATVKSNPLYTDKENTGNNPLSDNKYAMYGIMKASANLAGLTVYLVDAESGANVATTKTDDDGSFFFANVPSGFYLAKVTGSIRSKKGYDAYLSKQSDVAGELLLGNDCFSIELLADTGNAETAQAVIKTKTKSNQSNDRTNNTSASIWDSRSQKILSIATADVDGDGISELVASSNFNEAAARQSLLGGALPGGAVISAMARPGTPIGGIIVKGGKNPGGQMRTTTTNEHGEFEFTNWGEGNYTITAELDYYIQDETAIVLGRSNRSANNINTTESTLKDIPPVMNKIGGIKQGSMPNRISMNVTVPKQTQGATFGEKVNAGLVDNNNPTTRVRNNNTVRSNRIDNALILADLDGDGETETSFLSINGEVATITISEPGVNAEGAYAAGGISVGEETADNNFFRKTEPTGSKDVMQTQVKTGTQTGPVKWMAPEVIAKKVKAEFYVEELTTRSVDYAVAKSKYSTTDVAIKTVVCSDGVIVALTGNGDDYSSSSKISLKNLRQVLPVGNAAVWFVGGNGVIYKKQTDVRGRLSLDGLPPGTPLKMLMNLGLDGSDDVLISFTTDAQGNAISNVLKTKHDTAKNSIGNIR